MGLFDFLVSTAIGKTDVSNSFLGIGSKNPESAASNVVIDVPSPSTDLQPHGGSQALPTAAAQSGVQPAGFFKYGHPGPIVDAQFRAEYVGAYDRRTRNPHYIIEHLTPQSVTGNKSDQVDRKKSTFKEDESIPAKFRARLVDYFRSGYDRGHMAPAADSKFSQDAMDETFFLTNISPQVGDGFNRDYWAHFEDFCRRLTNKYNSVRIVTGPLFLPKKYPDGKYRISYEVIGNPPNVAVPTHFYKLIVAESPIQKSTFGGSDDEPVVGAFILPNDVIPNSTDLKNFYVPVDAIERASGLEFLSLLPDRKRKDLCREVECKIVVREFLKALPAPKAQLALAPPRNN
ncbi:hypothetical protein V1514DRAFT_282542 [Lipomyces japonicus]|uniref:uncharacterized protein n=1 Tax=Lipomyces japonicus TaxID=56871 RepID=UPI0034CD48B0